MKVLLFFVLLLNASLTVISATGFNDKVILQPLSSPSLVLRKEPGTVSPAVRMPGRQSWPNIVFLKHLFELECLKEFYNRSHLKNRSGSTKPESFVPGPEGPAYKTVNKNQGNNYDKIPESYRPNTSFENGKKYLEGRNVRVIPMPVSYRSNLKGYHRYKPDVSQEGNKLFKNSSPHSNQGDIKSKTEKIKHETISPFYTTTTRVTTSTTRNPIGGSTIKSIRFYPAEITDERVIPFNDLIEDKPGIPIQNNDNLPMMVSYGDAKTFSKFSHQSNRMKPTTASYPENTSSSNLWFESKPQPNHSYEVEEIIEENIRFDLEEKKEENHMTKKPLGRRQFKFDENAFEGLNMVVPNKMKPAKNEVIDSSIDTILNSLINPVKRIIKTEEKIPNKSYNSIITSSPPTLQNTFPTPIAKETFISLRPLLPQSNVEPSLPQEDKSAHLSNTKYVSIPPNPFNNYFSFFGPLATETAQLREKDDYPPHQSVSFQNFPNWETHLTSTRKFDELPLQPYFPKESQRDINFNKLAEMGQKTSDDFSTVLPMVKPKDLYLPEVFRDLADESAKPDGIFPTPKVVFTEENKMTPTFSPNHYDQPLNLFTSPQNRSEQSTTPPKSTQPVLFTTNLPEPYNNLDFQNLAERKEDTTVQQFFTSVPLTELMVEEHNTESELPERDERTTTQSEFFEIQTEFDLLDSKSKPEMETDHDSLTTEKTSDDLHSISESVAFENLLTTVFYTGNTGISKMGSDKLSSSSSTWMAVSKNNVKLTTERNQLEEDEGGKTTTSKEFTDVSMSDDLFNSSKKDSTQESNWKNSRKMHFNQEPKKVILDNRITDDTKTGPRRSDILINDTLEDYGENQISSVNYMDSLKENSSHLNAGSLIKSAPESIIPIIPQVINDLRDDRFSDENLKVLSHAFGKYWPYIQALSKNTNLDILPLMKMKNEKDLESILTSFVLEESSTTTLLLTTVKQQDDENILDYGHTYDYLDDYKEIYKDILNQELEKENRKKIRIKRTEEEDLKTMEATHEYFESIAEEQKEENGDYIYEDIMYDDIPNDESDSSIIELMEIADLQVYVTNVTSQESQK